MLIVKCDRCKKEIKSLEDALLLKWKAMYAHTLTTMRRTDIQMLDGGDDYVLCNNCSGDFAHFMTERRMIK